VSGSLVLVVGVVVGFACFVAAVIVLAAEGAEDYRRVQYMGLGTATPTPPVDADGQDHTADDEGRRPVGDEQGDD
jgi:hypothetical protein